MKQQWKNAPLILCCSGLLAAGAFAQEQIEPRAGTWKTWILQSGRELRLPAPPNRAATDSEIAWLKTFMASADANALSQVNYWDAGSPGLRWLEIVTDRIRDGRVPITQGWQQAVLLPVAIYDATVAAWDSKYAHNRPRPSVADSSLRPVLPVPASPSYPSEHAVVAGAAEVLLSHFFPAEADMFRSLAEEAGRSRLYAGLQYPTDVIDGLELGRAVGRKVVAHAMTDGFNIPWTGTVPTGPGRWLGANPVFANAPGWKPFLLSSAAEFRSPPPPAHDSPQTQAELAELKVTQPFLNQAKAFGWQTPEGNLTWFFGEITRRLAEHRLDTNPPRSARAYALMAVVTWDQIVCSHESKLTYWRIRPSQLDSTVPLLFPPPNHPSYPANHAVTSVRAHVLGYLFPRYSEYYRQLGEEIGHSRMWAGIHYRSDLEAGWEMARKLFEKLKTHAESDGSQQ
jgi:membrane-associated phospholipid phosphatase